MSESSLLDPLFDRVPELQDWWREAKELDLGLTSQTVDLANEILDRPPPETSQLLRKISPALELLLRDHDDKDEISLGFIHPLGAEAARRGLDMSAIRGWLGPLAQRTWDALHADRMQRAQRGPAV